VLYLWGYLDLLRNFDSWELFFVKAVLSLLEKEVYKKPKSEIKKGYFFPHCYFPEMPKIIVSLELGTYMA